MGLIFFLIQDGLWGLFVCIIDPWSDFYKHKQKHEQLIEKNWYNIYRFIYMDTLKHNRRKGIEQKEESRHDLKRPRSSREWDYFQGSGIKEIGQPSSRKKIMKALFVHLLDIGVSVRRRSRLVDYWFIWNRPIQRPY